MLRINYKTFAIVAFFVLFTFTGLLWIGSLKREITQSDITKQIPEPAITVPSDYDTFINQIYYYAMDLPRDWKQIEHSSNFGNLTTFAAQDGSILEIDSKEGNSLEITDYLRQKDFPEEKDLGKRASYALVSSEDKVINTYSLVIREEQLLEANQLVKKIYGKNEARKIIYEITVYPSSESKTYSEGDVDENIELVLNSLRMF